MKKIKKPIVLAILDGWGLGDHSQSDAVWQANMSFTEQLKKEYPYVKAHASGTWVGLPEGQMGNSEVGHIHIGAGRIKYESLSLINKAIENKSFYNNEVLNKAIEKSIAKDGNVHIMGLFSDGGVHSHLNHMIATYKLALSKGAKKIFFHLFGDGRDTKPSVFKNYLDILSKETDNFTKGYIATISGRYYSMDRDKRFERTELSYENMLSHKGHEFNDAYDYIDQEYKKDHTDEFLYPGYNINHPDSKIKNNDTAIFINFRPDRAIQLSSFFTNPNYLYKPKNFLQDLEFVCMMKYSDSVITNNIAFKSIDVNNGLGEWLSKQNVSQLRIAETEKIAHVTFFFDGGKDYFKNGLAKQEEIKLPNAYINLIDSPKVATYDLKPEMSAFKITDAIEKELEKDLYDVVILNYANCDMVGHTGVYDATVEAVKVMDQCIEQLYNAVKKHNGTLILTADHGNAEVMKDQEGGPNKKHTTNKVPIIITDKNIKLREKDAAIADIAPTILDLLNIEIPEEMTQPTLIKEK